MGAGNCIGNMKKIRRKDEGNTTRVISGRGPSPTDTHLCCAGSCMDRFKRFRYQTHGKDLKLPCFIHLPTLQKKKAYRVWIGNQVQRKTRLAMCPLPFQLLRPFFSS